MVDINSNIIIFFSQCDIYGVHEDEKENVQISNTDDLTACLFTVRAVSH